MSTRQQMQLLHPNHRRSHQFTSVVLVVIGSLLIGFVPLISGLGLTDTPGENWIIPTEAELWMPLAAASE